MEVMTGRTEDADAVSLRSTMDRAAGLTVDTTEDERSLHELHDIGREGEDCERELSEEHGDGDEDVSQLEIVGQETL